MHKAAFSQQWSRRHWPSSSQGTASRGSSGSRNTGSQTSGGLLLSVAPGILGSLVADLRGRGVEPALVGRVLAGPAGAHRRAAAAAPR